MLCLCILCSKEKVGNEVVVKARKKDMKTAKSERSQGAPRALLQGLSSDRFISKPPGEFREPVTFEVSIIGESESIIIH